MMTEAERFFAYIAIVLGVGNIVLGALLIHWRARALERDALLARYALGTWQPRPARKRKRHQHAT